MTFSCVPETENSIMPQDKAGGKGEGDGNKKPVSSDKATKSISNKECVVRWMQQKPGEEAWSPITLAASGDHMKSTKSKI
jgi:hypothetical protein